MDKERCEQGLKGHFEFEKKREGEGRSKSVEVGSRAVRFGRL